jgi:transcriptional regulator with XRE-family HTH domain
VRALTLAQNETVRELVRGLLAQEDDSRKQEALAGKLGMTQSGLSRFLARKSGTSFATVQLLAKLVKRTEWEILGLPAPRLSDLHPREVAAVLARQIHLSPIAIAEVLDEPLTQDTESWPVLWWTDRMRERHQEMLTRTGAPKPKAPRRGPR